MDKAGKRRRWAVFLVLERAIGPDSVQGPETGCGYVCFSLHIVLIIVFLCDHLSFVLFLVIYLVFLSRVRMRIYAGSVTHEGILTVCLSVTLCHNS